MSQTYTADVFGAAHVAQTDLQNMEDNFAALKSAFSGAGAPSNTVAGMWWVDTTAHILKHRDEANGAWLNVWDLANNKPVLTNVVSADFAAAMKDAAAATASLRTIGTTATAACAGNDARLGVKNEADLEYYTSGDYLMPGSYQIGALHNHGGTYDQVGYDIYIPRNGTIKVRIGMHGDTGFTPGTTYLKIYINGVAVGIERSKSREDDSWNTWDEDFTVADGDLLQVWQKGGEVSAIARWVIMIGVAKPTVPCYDLVSLYTQGGKLPA